MKKYLCSFILCLVYISVNGKGHGSEGLLDALRSDADLQDETSDPAVRSGIRVASDEELLNVALRFIEQLEQTRESLSGLRNVLDYIDTDLQERAQILEDRYVKSKGLWKLLKDAMTGADVTDGNKEIRPGGNKTKRMCRVNLGGHCQTENAASLANQMHFLSSGLSPGKRRRRATLAINKLSSASKKAIVSANDMDMNSIRQENDNAQNGI